MQYLFEKKLLIFLRGSIPNEKGTIFLSYGLLKTYCFKNWGFQALNSFEI